MSVAALSCSLNAQKAHVIAAPVRNIVLLNTLASLTRISLGVRQMRAAMAILTHSSSSSKKTTQGSRARPTMAMRAVKSTRTQLILLRGMLTARSSDMATATATAMDTAAMEADSNVSSSNSTIQKDKESQDHADEEEEATTNQAAGLKGPTAATVVEAAMVVDTRHTWATNHLAQR